MKKNLLILDFRSEELKPLIESKFPELVIATANNLNEIDDFIEETHILLAIEHVFGDDLLVRAAQLEWVQALTTGTDSLIALPSLKPEVLVTSARGIHGPQMSEMAFLHMLNLTRNYPKMLRNQDKSTWERWPQSLLYQKTVAIVGVGVIAENLAKKCKAFEMTVYGISQTPRQIEGFDRIFHREEICEAAGLADYLIVIVPYSAETHNLIDASVLESMKPGAFLINIARGGIVDEEALLEALEKNQIAGAGLDVFETMPLPAEHRFWKMENMLITPLLGGMSDVYLSQVMPILETNFRCFLNDEKQNMINIVEH